MTGKNTDENVIAVEVDGVQVEDSYTAERVGSRKIAYCKHNLEKGKHTAKIIVVSGSFSVDGVEVVGGDIELWDGSSHEAAEGSESSEGTAEQSVSTEESADDNGENPDEKESGIPIVPIVIGAAAVLAAGGVAAAVISKKKKK